MLRIRTDKEKLSSLDLKHSAFIFIGCQNFLLLLIVLILIVFSTCGLVIVRTLKIFNDVRSNQDAV